MLSRGGKPDETNGKEADENDMPMASAREIPTEKPDGEIPKSATDKPDDEIPKSATDKPDENLVANT